MYDGIDPREITEKYLLLKEKYKKLKTATKIQIDNLITSNTRLTKRSENAIKILEQ